MNTNQIARTAALMGEPARAAMLLALMDGRALTARELALAAGVSAATASRHLALLQEAGLLAMEKQGRHRYHRLASVEVPSLIENLMQVATPAAATVTTGPRDAALRTARVCYDHVAGRLGIAVADHLVDGSAVVLADGERADDEAALLRLVAPMLGVTDQESAMARQRVEAGQT